EQPVFICGHHRSGTTLLQQLCDGHPQLMVLPSEGTYFSSFKYVAHSNPDRRQIDRFITNWIERLIDPNQEPHFKLGRSTSETNPYLRFARRLLGWTVALRDARPALLHFIALLALAAAYWDLMHTSCKPLLWVEKTPLNEQHVRRFQ